MSLLPNDDFSDAPDEPTADVADDTSAVDESVPIDAERAAAEVEDVTVDDPTVAVDEPTADAPAADDLIDAPPVTDATATSDGSAAESIAIEEPVEEAEAAAPDLDPGGYVAEPEAEPAPDAADAETGPAPDAGTSEVTGDAEAEVVDAEDLLEEAAVEPEPEDSPWKRPGRWYVVHTQSGYEKKVKQNLEARTSSMNMEERIHEVVIPMEDVVDFKGGKKVVVQKKMFPGYLLVRCELDDDSWYVIRNTPGVTGFVGQGAKPSPLPRRDVESFLQVKKQGVEEIAAKARPRLEYEIGETVRVKEGPFADFSGEIIEINPDQLKVKVLVNIFGRETPVELEFSKVAKL